MQPWLAAPDTYSPLLSPPTYSPADITVDFRPSLGEAYGLEQIPQEAFAPTPSTTQRQCEYNQCGEEGQEAFASTAGNFSLMRCEWGQHGYEGDQSFQVETLCSGIPAESLHNTISSQLRNCCRRQGGRYQQADSSRSESARAFEAEARFDGSADGTPKDSWSQPRQGQTSRAVNVADRVRAFEAKAVPKELPKPNSKAKKPVSVPGAEPRHDERPFPVIPPLNISKTTRRREPRDPWRADTPLYHSTPDKDAVIYAPLPQRTFQVLRTPSPDAEQGKDLDGYDAVMRGLNTMPAGKYLPEAQLSSESRTTKHLRARSRAVARQEYDVASLKSTAMGATAYLHGTRGQCVRHGRKTGRASQRGSGGTRGLHERGSRGQYIPKGFSERHQVEATSPWINRNDHSDACPDCVTEFVIRKREVTQYTARFDARSYGQQNDPVPIYETQTSPFGEESGSMRRYPPTVTADTTDQATSFVGKISINQVADAQPFHFVNAPLPPVEPRGVSLVRSQSTATTEVDSRRSSQSGGVDDIDDPADNNALVTTADLGTELDAIILEQGGSLERIVLNLRRNAPVAQELERLSKELLQVARSMADANFLSEDAELLDEGSPTAVNHTRKNQREPLFDSYERTTDGSVSIQHPSATDSPLEEIRDPPEQPTPRDRRPALPPIQITDPSSTPLLDPLPSPRTRLANRQNIDASYEALRHHLGRGASYSKADLAETGATARLPARALRPEHTPWLDPFAAEVSALDRASKSTTLLPSHVLKARDLASPPPVGGESPASFSRAAWAELPGARDDGRGAGEGGGEGGVSGADAGRDAARADARVVRQAMRMGKSEAVQEAGEMERRARKQRQNAALARKVRE